MANPATPKLRVLFDELAPWRVASALRELRVRASYVGNEEDGAPPRGSPDSVVLDHAKMTNQVVVTFNHDMVMLAAELGQSVVWVDPYGRQLTREDWVLLVFAQLRRWDSLLGQQDAICIRALRSRCEAITLDQAYEMAERRMKQIRRRKATRMRAQKASPGQAELKSLN